MLNPYKKMAAAELDREIAKSELMTGRAFACCWLAGSLLGFAIFAGLFWMIEC